jgi:hypothetical protein
MRNRTFLPGGRSGFPDIFAGGASLFLGRHVFSFRLMTFEVLYSALMRFSFLQRGESPKVPAFPGLGILLA